MRLNNGMKYVPAAHQNPPGQENYSHATVQPSHVHGFNRRSMLHIGALAALGTTSGWDTANSSES